MKTHKLQTLKPRIRVMGTILEEMGVKTLRTRKTLKERQAENGRSLALNGAAWRKLREQVLRERPLCEVCYREGRMVSATDVDHRDNDPTNNERMNLASLCTPCHSRKTRQDYGAREVYGCDINGMPLDPEHPWNKE